MASPSLLNCQVFSHSTRFPDLKNATSVWPAVMEERPSDAAGRDGENAFVTLMEKKTGARIFREVRVRSADGVTRNEIDVVLAARACLIVVEVKNWAGTVTLAKDGSWTQQRRDGRAAGGPLVP